MSDDARPKRLMLKLYLAIVAIAVVSVCIQNLIGIYWGEGFVKDSCPWVALGFASFALPKWLGFQGATARGNS